MFALASAFFDLMEKEIKESNRRTEDNSLWQPIQQLKDQKPPVEVELFPMLFVDSCVPIRVFVIEQNSGRSVARAPIGQRFLF